LVPLVRYLLSAGNRVVVVAPSAGASRVGECFKDVEVIRLPQPFSGRGRPAILANLTFAFAAALTRVVRADVFIALTGLIYDVLPARVAAARTGKACVAYVDNIVDRRRPGTSWWRLVDGACASIAEASYRGFDALFAGSVMVRDQLQEVGVPPERVHVIRYGIEEEALQTARTTEVRRVRGRAVFAGRINEGTGIFDLLTAWPEIVRQIPSATLVIIGRGDKETEARFHRHLAHLRHRDTVRYLGFVDPVRKFKELLQAQALLFPTYTEQYSLAVAEALVCGLRVVGYDIEGFRVNFPGLIDMGPVGDIPDFVRRAVAVLQEEPTVLVEKQTSIGTSYEPSLIREFDVIRGLTRCEGAEQEKRYRRKPRRR
jgi:glycosyltransferase involved in cell wall biosynthesis